MQLVSEKQMMTALRRKVDEINKEPFLTQLPYTNGAPHEGALLILSESESTLPNVPVPPEEEWTDAFRAEAKMHGSPERAAQFFWYRDVMKQLEEIQGALTAAVRLRALYETPETFAMPQESTLPFGS